MKQPRHEWHRVTDPMTPPPDYYFKPMNKPIDFTKPVQTRDGRAVRILCTDGPNKNYPVIGVIAGAPDTDNFTKDGSWIDSNQNYSDLVNAPEKRVVWVNIYEGEHSNMARYLSKEKADAEADRSRIACVKVEFTIGEGL